MKTLNDLFEHTLKDVYYAKNAIKKTLPKVQKEAKHAELVDAIANRASLAKAQVATIERIFKSIGKKAEGEKCDAIEGLIKETEGLLEEATGAVAINAGLVAAMQAIAHYEISRFGALREWAKTLGYKEAHTLLGELLDEEKAFNNQLTNLAVTTLNVSAGKKAA